MELRLKGTDAVKQAPHPRSRGGRGSHLGAQQASWARMGRANSLLSSPAPLVLEGPSCLPLPFSPQPPSYALRTNVAGGGEGLGGQGTGLGAYLAGSPGSSGWGNCPPSSSPTPPGGPLRCLPLLISLASAHRSCLASTSPLPSVPPCPTSSLGGSSHLLGCQGPPPAADRRPSCGEMLIWHLPTPPS